MIFRTRRFSKNLFIFGICACALWIFARSVFHCQSSQNDSARNVENNKKDYHFSTNLLIVVLSAPSHKEVRDVIRQTWASKPPLEVKIRFVVGVKHLPLNVEADLKNEQQLHNDLISLEKFEDSYNALTMKLIETFKFVNQHVRFNFLMKVDEDSFVRVDKVSDELLSKPQERLYWGFFDGRAHVKKSGKWEERDYVLCDRYLPYALGGGYVLSKDLITYVAENSHLFSIFKSEDASLGTWLGPLNIHRSHDTNFDTEFVSRGCFNSYIVTHKKSPDDLKELQNNMIKLGQLCTQEKRTRLSYEYDWTVSPTKCCERKDPSIP